MADAPGTDSTTAPARRPGGGSRRQVGRLVALVVCLGPGILAMAGDNDAGGLLAYAATGAGFGTRFFVALLLPLGVLTFAVQEMATRLAVGTGRALPELVTSVAGGTWARVLALDLAIQNTATLIAEFAGMAVGLAHFGVPVPLGAALSLVAVAGVLVLGNYRTTERIGLTLVAVNLLFLPLVLSHLPAPRALLPWPTAQTAALAFFGLFAVGVAGNAIAPWMPFFQMDAVRAHGWTGPGDLRAARQDLLIGTVIQLLVAAAVIAVAARAPVAGVFQPGPWLASLARHSSVWVSDLFAVGLFDAGFVACLTVSYSTVWTVVRTWRGQAALDDMDRTVSRSPWATAIFALGLLLAAALVALPGAPLALFAVATQALSAVLMPPVILVLWALASRRRLLGPLANSVAQNLVALVALVVFVGAVLILLLPGGI